MVVRKYVVFTNYQQKVDKYAQDVIRAYNNDSDLK